MSTTLNKLILILAGFCTSLNSTSQESPVSIMSPEVATLGKYGTYNVSQYTGTPNISVPVYQIKDNGINIPISLSYDASGFIPNKNSGIVGHNWTLVAGGAITRVVKGEPDEKFNPNSDDGGENDQRKGKGYIYGIQNGLTPHCSSPECIETLDFLEEHTDEEKVPWPTELSYENNPDIFTFNFLDHSGSFFMGLDGEVKVRSDRKYKVDVSNLKPQYDWSLTLNGFIDRFALDNNILSEIKMTAEDGTVFYFGGSVKNVEISFSFPDMANGNANTNTSANKKSGVINAWYLTKMILPDGQIAEFKYEDYDASETVVIKQFLSGFVGNWISREADFMEVKLYYKEFYEETSLNFQSPAPIWYTYHHETSYAMGFRFGKSVTKLAYLSEISTPLYKVNFQYSRKNDTNHPFYGGSSELGVTPPHYWYSKKLDQITITDKADVHAIDGPPDFLEIIQYPKNIDFAYSYEGSTNSGYRLMLRSLKFQGDDHNKYSFDYSGLSQLPHPLTRGIDKWGFYNGYNNNLSLIGFSSGVDSEGSEFEVDFSSPTRYREANPLVADVGLLKTITYPTGGVTTFDFEAHTFSKILKRKVHPTSGNNYIPEWVTESGYAGGARIKTISSSPGTTTNFKYINDYPANTSGPSSGLLTDYGVFRFKAMVSNDSWTHSVFDNNYAAAMQYSEPHITYKEVVSVEGDGSNGYTQYLFTNHETNPDDYFINNSFFKYFMPIGIHANFGKQIKRLNTYSSRVHERGKLKKTAAYNASNQIQNSSEYVYNENANRFNVRVAAYDLQYAFGFYLFGSEKVTWLYNAFRNYYYHYNLTQQIDKTYGGAATITQTTNYVYRSDSDPTLIEKRITRSDGITEKETYTYPNDINTGVYAAMVSKHMLSPVIEKKFYRNSLAVPVTFTLLETKKTHFADIFSDGTFYAPIKTSLINHTVSPVVEQDLDNFTYYSDRKLKETFKTGDVKTRYLWGYLGQLPIAKIVNAGSDNDSYYSSFETSENGGWFYNDLARKPVFSPPSGNTAFELFFNSTTQSISRSGLNTSKKYSLSFWHKDGTVSVGLPTPAVQFSKGGWNYKEYHFTGVSSINISGTGLIDELRLIPENAVMETYGYQPMFGMISSSNHAGVNTFYEYDKHARLIFIRGEDREIRKKICYNLYGEVEACGFEHTIPLWEPTGITRCAPCSANPNYTNGYQEIQQRDNNPFSSTYNEVRWYPNGLDPNCAPQPDWQNTVTATRCKQSGGSNTGQVEQEQKDMNPCSPSYNTIQWVVIGTNTGMCPTGPVCTTSNCLGVNKKCVNGHCETGVKVIVDCQFDPAYGKWRQYYVWEFSDNSWSQVYDELILSGLPCVMEL